MRFLFYCLLILSSLNSSAQFFDDMELTYIANKKVGSHLKIEGIVIHFYSVKENKIADSVLYQQNYYDTSGNLIRLKGPTSESTYSYTAGKLIVATEEPHSKIYKLVHEFKYDSLGRLTEEFSHAADSSHSLVFRYEYLDSNRIKAIYRNIDKSKFRLYKSYKYSGDEKISVTEVKNEIDRYTIIYEYNKALNNVMKYYLVGKKKIKGTEMKYDNSGKLIERTYFLDDRGHEGSYPLTGITREEFVYDSSNNLASKKTVFLDNKMTGFFTYAYFHQ